MNDVLIGHMMRELVEAGIEVRLYSKKKINSDGGGAISGAFTDEDKILEVAASREDWLLILAHEYCHFKQWQQGLFDDVMVIAAYSCFTPWLEKRREIPADQLETFIRKMQWLELDNEKRTIELLKEFKVDFDEEKYIKKTNIYMYSYELCRRLQRWHSKPMYDVPELLDLVSGDRLLTEEEFGDLPEGFEALAIGCYDFSERHEEEEE